MYCIHLFTQALAKSLLYFCFSSMGLVGPRMNEALQYIGPPWERDGFAPLQ
jgi:hypothetical protein